MRLLHLTSVLRAAPAAVLLGALLVAPRVAGAAPCPTSSLQLNTLPAEELAGPEATGARSDGYMGYATYHFREYGDSAYFGYSGCCGTAAIMVRARYRFLGAAPGTWLSTQVQTHVTASTYGYGGDPFCEQTWARLALSQNQSLVAFRQISNVRSPGPGDDNCYGALVEDLTFTCTQQAGVEFELGVNLSAHIGEGLSESGRVAVKRTFGTLPPGAFLVRCDGDTTIQVVGVGTSSTAALRIDGIWPNPSKGAFRAAISIPVGGPAIARLLDVNGRVLETRAWDASHASRRELAFERALPPGFYFLKVSQGAVTAVREVVVRH